MKRRRRPWPVAHRITVISRRPRLGRSRCARRPPFRPIAAGGRPGRRIGTRALPRRRGGRESDRGRSSLGGARSGHRSGRSRPVAGPDGVSGPWSAAGVIGCDTMVMAAAASALLEPHASACLYPACGASRLWFPGSQVMMITVSYIRTSGKHPNTIPSSITPSTQAA